MPMGLPAPSSPRPELEAAKALAIDWGEAEDDGLEQAGDIHRIQQIIREAVGEQIEQRLIRRVVKASEEWGPKDAIVDTTERDAAEARLAEGAISHWYLDEGVSPAIMVLETEQSTVLDVLNDNMDPMSVHMLFFLGMQPVAALPRAGMSGEDIIRSIEERNLTVRSPRFFPRTR